MIRVESTLEDKKLKEMDEIMAKKERRRLKFEDKNDKERMIREMEMTIK